MNPFPDEVRAWLHKANSDLLSAQILVEHSPLVLGPAAFHCQQAVEKTLRLSWSGDLCRLRRFIAWSI